jgi:S-adenosylmethionine hydrolase
MIVLFTDFGLSGPYIGQMEAVLYEHAPHEKVINLLADAPVHNPKASAYLLPAYCAGFPEGTVFLCVVDPGVGSRSRKPVVMFADGHWYVGPNNGLFNIIRQRATEFELWEIILQPEGLSSSFHGRDLFAPVAAHIATDEVETGWLRPIEAEPTVWEDDLYEVIYIDHFGNAITGIQGYSLEPGRVLQIKGRLIQRARTFSDVAVGEAFYYTNSSGLIEIAINQGKADVALGLQPGDDIS